MIDAPSSATRIVRFGPFELDLRSGELRRNGSRVSLQEQPLQILSVLLERPGELVTREELRQRLWPADTFVDFEHGLNAAVKRLRDALGDSAETPRFVETVPRRGYRFIAAVDGVPPADERSRDPRSPRQRKALGVWAALLASAVAGYVGYRLHRPPPMMPERTLTRLTFAPGLQTDPSWSPDGHLIAYASDQSGNFDIWVQPVAGGRAVQVTDDLAHDWQPDWSPDGKLLVFRSERDGGGLYVVPPLGGAARKLTTFGVRPRWSPDGSSILFGSPVSLLSVRPVQSRPFIVVPDGSPPQQVSAQLLPGLPAAGGEFGWHPDGRLSYSSADHELGHPFNTLSLGGGAAVRSNPAPGTDRSFEDLFLSGFNWSPSGRALYFTMDARHRWAKDQLNLWRIDVDPQTLRWIGGPHRLTTGPGADTALALSPDGRSLAFSETTARTRIMSLRVDHRSGRAIGGLEAHTGPEAKSIAPDVARDGKALIFMRLHPEGNVANELRRQSLADGRDTILSTWGPRPFKPEGRGAPRLSRDGRRVAYAQYLGPSGTPPECAIIIADAETGEVQQVMAGSFCGDVFDWSLDGQSLLVSLQRGSGPVSIWSVPLVGASQAEGAPRLIAADATNNLWQARFSPDGRWIAVNAVASPDISTIYVVSSSGGAWTQITEGRGWDDKPRWSPDGRRLYFLSARHGALNVWSIGFDPTTGVVLGQPSPATTFNGPGLMVSDDLGVDEIAVSNDRLFLPLQEITGAVWMLTNVDQ